jgi:hypothetical protein
LPSGNNPFFLLGLELRLRIYFFRTLCILSRLLREKKIERRHDNTRRQNCYQINSNQRAIPNIRGGNYPHGVNRNRVKEPLQRLIRVVHPVKQARENPRYEEVAHTERERGGEDEAVVPREAHVREGAQAGDGDGGEEEGRDVAEDGVGGRDKGAGDFAEDAEEDEEDTAPAAGGAVGPAGNGDGAVVLVVGMKRSMLRSAVER